MPVLDDPPDFDYESTQRVPKTVTITNDEGVAIDVWAWQGTMKTVRPVGQQYRLPGDGYTYYNLSGNMAPTTEATFIDAYTSCAAANTARDRFVAMSLKYVQLSFECEDFPAVLVHSVDVSIKRGSLGINRETPPATEFGDPTYEFIAYTWVLSVRMQLEIQDFTP